MANGWGAIEAEIRAKMMDAMNETESKSYEDADRHVSSDFYSQGSPTMYERTGTLGGTARSTGVQGGGNSVSADIYLDTGISYSTGTYSGAQVISEAEVGGSGILGKPGFWKDTEEDIQKNLDAAFGSRFD